jgi:SAM-dependent methyltransferase
MAAGRRADDHSVDGASPCCVCGGSDLVKRFAVAGEVGPQGMIPTTDRFGTALADVVRCRRCGHMQLEQLPSEADLAEAYERAESTDYVEEEAGQRQTARAVLGAIEEHVAPGELLDVGCWVGFLLDEARQRGWNTTGVEPSRFASAFARERLGLNVLNADLLTDRLPEGRFRAVFMGDVIEHLPDPREAVRRAGDLLAPGGVLALALPDAGSRLARAMGSRWWSVIPTHLHYFTRDSIRMLLRTEGFHPFAVRTSPKTFTVRYYLRRLDGYRPRAGWILMRAAERLRVADRLWTPDFRDRMLVIAGAPRR